VQLSGEEINTQVTVLSSGSRGGDADDLARTSLKDQEIAHTDVVAGNGDSERGALWLGAGRDIFIVVTHFVGEKARRFDGFFGDTDFFFVDGGRKTTRWVDCLFGNTNFFFVG